MDLGAIIAGITGGAACGADIFHIPELSARVVAFTHEVAGRILELEEVGIVVLCGTAARIIPRALEKVLVERSNRLGEGTSSACASLARSASPSFQVCKFSIVTSIRSSLTRVDRNLNDMKSYE